MNHYIKTLRLMIVSAVFLCSLPLFPALAEEVIKRFDSLVQVGKDGTFTVTETITVKAEGRKIRRGIFRDFPLLFEDERGKKLKVGFKLISVKRDDKWDMVRVKELGDRVRIYIGRKDYFLPEGVYTYTIVYETTRQMRYFETHDEIYWNATGNFWDFPIETVLAQIVLPEGAAATDWDVFTGKLGSKEKDATIGKIAGKRVIKYRTTRTLKPGEGMTVLAKVDKGVISPPSDAQLSQWFWQDNKATIVGLIGLFLVSLYYMVMWWRVGRDLPPGVIVPRWDVSKDMSPGLVNYIDKKGLAGKGFDAIASAVLSLAVKKHVTLDDDNGILAIQTNVGRVSYSKNLSVGERVIYEHIKRTGNDELIVSINHGSSVKKLQQNFASAMEKEHRNKFYKHNILMVALGVTLSIITLVLVLAVGSFSEEAFIFLFVAGIFTAIFCAVVIGFVKNTITTKSMIIRIVNLIVVGLSMFAFMSFGVGVAAKSILSTIVDHWPVMTIIGIIILNVLFFFLLGAPTALGRKKMDEIEGLKTYLTLAEKDRMNMNGAPDFSTAHYEELLPYAVALGVEKPWSSSFETWLAAAVAAGTVAASYRPDWYRGRHFRSDNLSSSMDDFTSSMQSGFSSAMPVPKSSSSGFSGGGSSGGGGGGGGGGGW